MNNKPDKEKFTTDDFESMSWHDNMIHGLSLDTEEWKSDLILDIDYIVKWLEPKDCEYRFSVAPATLTFHDVDKLSIHFELGQMRDIWIFSIDRQPKATGKAYDWVINLSTLNKVEDKIAFESTGFTQVLRANPVITEDQHLETSQRKKMEQMNK